MGRPIDPMELAAEAGAIAEERFRFPPGGGGIEPGGLELFSPELEVKLELGISLVFGRTAAEGQPKEAAQGTGRHQLLAAARIFPTTATYRRHSASSARSCSRPALVSS
jgi:hypothetical protein